jgi:hypothetical protein
MFSFFQFLRPVLYHYNGCNRYRKKEKPKDKPGRNKMIRLKQKHFKIQKINKQKQPEQKGNIESNIG